MMNQLFVTCMELFLDDHEFVQGLLLTYIDCPGLPLSMRVIPEHIEDPPLETRQRWMSR